MEEEKQKTGFGYYVFNTLIVLAATFVALIPASMAYNVRVFSGSGLPHWMQQAVSMAILVAPPFAVLVTGLVRVYAVTDKKHADALTIAAILEGLACGAETIAALIPAGEWYMIVARMLFLGGAVALVFAALVITLVKNGLYQLAVMEHERALNFEREFARLFNEEMQTDTARAEMQRAVVEQIHKGVERAAGRRIYAHPSTGKTNANNQHAAHAESPTSPA